MTLPCWFHQIWSCWVGFSMKKMLLRMPWITKIHHGTLELCCFYYSTKWSDISEWPIDLDLARHLGSVNCSKSLVFEQLGGERCWCSISSALGQWNLQSHVLLSLITPLFQLLDPKCRTLVMVNILLHRESVFAPTELLNSPFGSQQKNSLKALRQVVDALGAAIHHTAELKTTETFHYHVQSPQGKSLVYWSYSWQKSKSLWVKRWIFNLFCLP